MPPPKSSSAPGDTKGEAAKARAGTPLDLVMLTRERIQDTLDDFARRGRLTRHDANELVAELVRRGREQTEDLWGELETLVGSATRRARRAVVPGGAFPIEDYESLTAAQVVRHLAGLTPTDLRRVREYERRHANRKTVLDAVGKAL